MFERLMAAIGVGAAKVDLVLDRREWRLGETVTGTLWVVPGKVDQEVERVYVWLYVTCTQEDKRYDVRVQSVEYPGMFLRAGGGRLSIPFSFTIPVHLPVTRPGVNFHFASGLDIDQAVDPADRDAITVYPSGPMETVLRAMQSIGIVEKWASAELERQGQELEFHVNGPLSGYMKELDVVFVHEPDALRLYLEVERRMRGLGGMFMEKLDLNEQRSQLRLPYAALASGSDAEVRATAQAIYDHLGRIVSQLPTGPVANLAQYGSRPGQLYPQGGHHGGHGYGHGGHHQGSGVGGAVAGFLGGMVVGSVVDEVIDTVVDGFSGDDDDGGGGGGDDGGWF